jgi:branched-chain amino acid transport system permease protein
MAELLQQIATGLSNGGIYASLALALVMVYRSTGHVNFAQGEMATLSTFVAWTLVDGGIPYWAAFPLTVAIAFGGGVLVEGLLVRPLRRRSELSLVTSFLGVLMICNSLSGWIWGYDPRAFPSLFENAGFLANAYASPENVGTIVVTLVLMAALFLFFQYSRTGLAMRASADNPTSSHLVGISVLRMSSLGWGMAAAIGAVAGMVIAPSLFLDPNMMMGVLIYGLAGAVLGGINNPWGAVAGGFIVGVIENLLGVYVIGTEIRMSVALIAIVATLVVRPEGLFGFRTVSRV